MSHVLTLIAGGDAALDHSTIDAVRQASAGEGLALASAEWLAEGKACDLPIAQGDPAAVLRTARGVIGDSPIDVATVPLAHRRKKLLIADMDSTIVTSETLDELAAEAGVGDKVAPITARARRFLPVETAHPGTFLPSWSSRLRPKSR